VGVLAGVNDDDCGVVRVAEGLVLATTDFLNARPIATHLGVGGPFELGRLVVASNLSDLCGSGARPLALLVGLMARRDPLSEAETLFGGIAFEAKRWGVPVIGGDTKLGEESALIGTAIGFGRDRQELFLMNGAEADQDVYLSGPVGGCCAAVLALGTGNASAPDWARRAITEPNLPLARSRAASQLRLSAGGTDVSDGLAADLHSMCKASGIGAEIHLDSLPIAEEAIEVSERRGVRPASLALVLGGDFQFLMTAPSTGRDTLEAIGMSWIGRTTRDSAIVARSSRGVISLPDLGHRDGRRLSFVEEVEVLVETASESM
ncbi:MAG: thiamine-phosphate kinase, partial [Actinobacteria bacterium]|nr:thiamine-phosphate kinase [Actinomycetota bacterium]